MFARAHYVGGQPSLGGSLDGPLRVTAAAVGMSGGGDDPGLTVATADVAKASLYAAQAPASAGVTASVAAAAQVSGATEAEDRTFLVVHLRPRGYQAFAIDGMASDAVRAARGPCPGGGRRAPGGARAVRAGVADHRSGPASGRAARRREP